MVLNPHANDFIPNQNFLTSKLLNPSATVFVHNQNTVDVNILDPCAAMFISTYKLSTPMLNSCANLYDTSVPYCHTHSNMFGLQYFKQ